MCPCTFIEFIEMQIYCQKIDATANAKRIRIVAVDHQSHRYVEWVSMQCSSLPCCRSWLKKPVSDSKVDRELKLLRIDSDTVQSHLSWEKKL